jgi:lipoprotein-releasing system permease protein
MVRIAIATTAHSLAVMIVAVAVIMGFRREISDTAAGFGGHLRVQALDYGMPLETAAVRLDPAFEADIARMDGVQSIAPFAFKGGIVRTDAATRGVVLKGIDGSYDTSFFEDCLLEGALPRVADSVRHKDILISTSVARTLSLAVDDRVEILFVYPDRNPRRDRFRVCGLYSSGLEEMDGRFALADIADVRRLNGWDDGQITGYEIALDDMSRLENAEKEIYVRTVAVEEEPPLMVRSLYAEFPQIFDWLKTHDVNAVVIITIMLTVALISMISALLIILLERTSMIGLLKALGMRSGAVRKIFIMRSAYILGTGLLIGNAFGIGLALVQKYTGAVSLDRSGYFISAVPIELGWTWIVALNVGMLAVILALLIIPTGMISRITPEKTIRYQ